jgi:hypothetical protein
VGLTAATCVMLRSPPPPSAAGTRPRLCAAGCFLPWVLSPQGLCAAGDLYAMHFPCLTPDPLSTHSVRVDFPEQASFQVLLEEVEVVPSGGGMATPLPPPLPAASLFPAGAAAPQVPPRAPPSSGFRVPSGAVATTSPAGSRPLAEGQAVRVRQDLPADPTYGWGVITPASVGKLHALVPSRATVHFEAQKGWLCVPQELECVFAVGDTVRVKASVVKPVYVRHVRPRSLPPPPNTHTRTRTLTYAHTPFHTLPSLLPVYTGLVGYHSTASRASTSLSCPALVCPTGRPRPACAYPAPPPQVWLGPGLAHYFRRGAEHPRGRLRHCGVSQAAHVEGKAGGGRAGHQRVRYLVLPPPSPVFLFWLTHPLAFASHPLATHSALCACRLCLDTCLSPHKAPLTALTALSLPATPLQGQCDGDH